MRQIHTGCAHHIRESNANAARTCHAMSAQQGMLLLDLSVILIIGGVYVQCFGYSIYQTRIFFQVEIPQTGFGVTFKLLNTVVSK
jgi:hypothetical protein